MKTIRQLLAVAIVALTATLAVTHGILAATAFLFVAGVAYSRQSLLQGQCLTPTLTVQEIMVDIIQAFTQWVPGLQRMGTDFRAQKLLLDQTYTAHITSVPSVEDVSTTYAVTGQNARDLLVDVPITVNSRKGSRLKWQHLNFLKDQKNKYDEAMALAGYALARDFMLNVAAQFKTVNFSQESVFSEANSDVDMLINVCGDMNTVGASPVGRTMLVNTNVANTLAADSRLTSRDYLGQTPTGNSMRRFVNAYGFAEVVEWPELPLNNGTAITGGAIEADDNIYTKASHGLVTGDRVELTSLTGGTGVTAGNFYYFHRLTANTGYLCETPAAAQAGTAINVTLDASSVELTPTENITGFAFDRRAIAILAGYPDQADQDRLISQLGIQKVMNFIPVTDPISGLTMTAVTWQESGTGDLNFIPVMVWGKSLGRQAGSTAAGQLCDYAGHLLRKA